ncbi:hypothetical protein J4409_00365 [Candidatus Woesearchaeota archaeon]|nr:hypothetical protein [Candidatus Woesearchaeota archaeon]
MSKIGSWSFIIGLIIAILAGLLNLANQTGIIALVLVILGLIVGFLNVSGKEATPFLIAAIALLATSSASLSIIPTIGVRLSAIIGNIAVFVAPAAIIVAIKEIYSLARN